MNPPIPDKETELRRELSVSSQENEIAETMLVGAADGSDETIKISKKGAKRAQKGQKRKLKDVE